jgi:Predicted endonuclease containing a URI domain
MSGWAYMLRCADQSYYVGSTSLADIDDRVCEHNDGKYGGYTATRRPVVLVWCDWFQDIRQAQDTERRIKGWSRAKKEALIQSDWKSLRNLAKRPAARPPSRPGAPC